ncbi:MAG: CBS domain-containing protein [Myxococcota bacterium]|nr:CBS domain-containing protein [Myxococcota bacterium]
MRRDFVAVPAGEPLAEALGTMRLARLRHLLVERDGKLAGILSYRDLQDLELERLARDGPAGAPRTPVAVEEAMMASPYVVTPETPLASAASRMCQLRVGCLPVVSPGASGGELVGIVTESDLLDAAYAEL